MIQLQSGKVPLAGPKTERIQCALCPTMDLITFAGGGQAHVTALRSIDWEKLFSSVCANTSGAMAWRPDGKEIAVGTTDGRIILLKTETGLERDVDGSFQATPEGEAEAQIGCLHWTVDRINKAFNKQEEGKLHNADEDSDLEDQDEMLYEDTDDEDAAFASHSFLRVPKKLPQLTAAGKLKIDDDYEHSTVVEEDKDATELFAVGSRCEKALLKGNSLDVLVTGDDRGTVSCHAFGHFTIGAISLRSLSPGDQDLPTRITHVFLADNLKAIVAVAQKSREEEGLHEFYLCTISTKILSTARRHIAAVASEFTFIRAELGRLQSALDQAVRFWEEGVLGSLRKLFAPLVDEEESLREARGQTPNRRQMLDDVLFELFVKGVFATSLVRYFTKQSEANISKICRVWDVACDALIKLLEHTCTPSVEGLIFRLGDLIGKSQADEEFQSIGVDPALLDPFLKDSERLILAIQRVALGVREAKQDLNSLERWLIGCRRRWPGGAVYHPMANQSGPVPFPHEDAKRVERMLFESDIEHCELSAQLGLKQRASSIVAGKKSVPSWDRAYTEDDTENEGLFPSSKLNTPQVCDLVANLSTKWKGIMPRVRETMNRSFVLHSAKLLFSITTDEDTEDVHGRITLGSVQRDTIDVAFVGSDQRNLVTVLSCNTKAEHLTWKTRLQPYRESEGDEVTHVAFCGSTPGRASTLEGSIFALTTSARHLKILGDTGTDQLTVLRDAQMEFRPVDAIANISCSGPRGVACVFTLRRNFELYDIVHEEEELEE